MIGPTPLFWRGGLVCKYFLYFDFFGQFWAGFFFQNLKIVHGMGNLFPAPPAPQLCLVLPVRPELLGITRVVYLLSAVIVEQN